VQIRSPGRKGKAYRFTQKMTVRGNGMVPVRITLIKRSSIVLFAYLGAMITGMNQANSRLANTITSLA